MTLTQIVPAEGAGVPRTWEEQYLGRLRDRGSISSAGIREIQSLTDQTFSFIGDALDPDSNKSVAGALIGAVQSGKTGLMINLAARALDRGFRCVVVLAGLRDDLRTQTALRFLGDLLQRGDAVPRDLGGGFTDPRGLGYHGFRRDCWSPLWKDDVNHDSAFSYLFSKTLLQGHSVLAIAKKNVTSLNHLRETYEFAISQTPGGKLPLLVIDDECDEASVSEDEEAPTPDRIAQVWSGLAQQVAYVGFTATPAANLLQDTSSRLFPGDFVLTLRVPGDAETSLSYLEPDPDRRYTGGDVFYRFFDAQRRPNFLVEAGMTTKEFGGSPNDEIELERALQAYFVSGAVRLVEQGLPAEPDLGAAERQLEPHTMLAHTESTIASHWRLCERIVRLIKVRAGRDHESRRNIARIRPADRISSDDLCSWLRLHPESWEAWHAEFRASRELLLEISPDRARSPFPQWDAVRSALAVVFKMVKLRVVNSDDASIDAPLQFQPTFSADGASAPRDVYSIIIGGNQLSRGLTIEGLCVSYYTRSSSKLVEDATVQRERWFGYRGRYLEFCRLFTHQSLAIRLRRFHEHDEDLRRQLAWNAGHGRKPVDSTYRFLTIRDSVPTSKLGRGRGPLRFDVSGTRIFVDRVQMGCGEAEILAASSNENTARDVASVAHSEGVSLDRDGTCLGRIRSDVPAGEIAALLERLVFTFHNPDPLRGVGWNLRDFYRPHDPRLPPTDYGLPPSSDPFFVAAFLRFWSRAHAECLADSTVSRYRASDGISDWRPVPPPRFNLVVRHGTLTPDRGSPFAFPLLNREVDANGNIGSRWGGRGGGIGDEWIDLNPPSGDPDAPRNRTQPGLFLLHVIGRQARGRKGYGEPYGYDRPCVGMVIPEGGPSLNAVLAED